MAADDSDPPKNPFVRWKQHVDAHIGMTLNGLLGIPSIVSKNLNIRRDDGAPEKCDAAAAGGGGDASAAPAPPSDDNNALDGVDATQLLEWHKFIYYSPYSPLKLQQQQYHHLLPPPVPQDVPFGADPYAFSYADAFEDLLRASSGRPLLDLAARSYRNLRYHMRYGSAVEPPYVFFHRMHSERLLDSYFVRGADSASDNTVAVTNTPDNVAQAVSALDPDRKLWSKDHRDDDMDFEDEGVDLPHDENENDQADRFDDYDDVVYGWEHQDDQTTRGGHDNSPLPGSRQTSSHGGLFDELDRVFRVLSRIIDEDTGAATAGAKKPNSTDDAAAAKKPNSTDDASAEDELYNAVRSAYAKAEKSLSTFMKAVTGIAGDISSSSTTEMTSETSLQRQQPTTTTTRQGETIHTTEEHTDMFGNRHVKTTVRRLDADGNEVARETRYTIRSSSSSLSSPPSSRDVIPDIDEDDESGAAAVPAKAAAEPAKDTNKDVKAATDSAKKPGWFWK